MFLYSREAVCYRTDAAALDVVCVVPRSAVVVILTFLYTISDDYGKECCGHLCGILVAKIVVHFYLCLYCVSKLFFECRIEIVKGLKFV